MDIHIFFIGNTYYAAQTYQNTYSYRFEMEQNCFLICVVCLSKVG